MQIAALARRPGAGENMRPVTDYRRLYAAVCERLREYEQMPAVTEREKIRLQKAEIERDHPEVKETSDA